VSKIGLYIYLFIHASISKPPAFKITGSFANYTTACQPAEVSRPFAIPISNTAWAMALV